jgi:hypothetical protein
MPTKLMMEAEEMLSQNGCRKKDKQWFDDYTIDSREKDDEFVTANDSISLSFLSAI